MNDDDLSANYIIGMDKSNIENIKKFLKNRYSGKVQRLLEFAGEDRDILDPWYTDDFDATYNDVVKGCKALLNFIKKYDLSIK